MTLMSSWRDSSWRNLLSVIIFSGSHCWKEKNITSINTSLFLTANPVRWCTEPKHWWYHQYTKHCGPDWKPFNPRVHDRTAPFFPVVFSFKIKEHFTLMQSSAACLASWFSVDGPLCPDCSAPLNVNQLTKLNTADSPLAEKKTVNSCNFHQCNQVKI